MRRATRVAGKVAFAVVAVVVSGDRRPVDVRAERARRRPDPAPGDARGERQDRRGHCHRSAAVRRQPADAGWRGSEGSRGRRWSRGSQTSTFESRRWPCCAAACKSTSCASIAPSCAWWRGRAARTCRGRWPAGSRRHAGACRFTQARVQAGRDSSSICAASRCTTATSACGPARRPSMSQALTVDGQRAIRDRIAAGPHRPARGGRGRPHRGAGRRGSRCAARVAGRLRLAGARRQPGRPHARHAAVERRDQRRRLRQQRRAGPARQLPRAGGEGARRDRRDARRRQAGDRRVRPGGDGAQPGALPPGAAASAGGQRERRRRGQAGSSTTRR